MFSVIFPGQGSQLVGMGKEFHDKFEIVKNLFKEADDTLEFSISKLILEGPKEDLDLTENTQPAIFLLSYSIFKLAKEEFNINLHKASFFAGHSLGEYSALVCAESVNFKDALELLFERGKSMQEAVPIGDGSMLAILGLDLIEINNYIINLKSKGVCEIANDNARGQIIVSGNTETIEELRDILKKNKKKSIVLPVSAPFHCSLMNSAANKMKDKIKKINFRKPDYEIISNVTSQPTNNPEEFKELLVEQIYSRVRWRESILFMGGRKINTFIEIGPGKVLTGLVKRILPNSNSFSINSINDIKNLKNES